jgi:aldose 1-epimerase
MEKIANSEIKGSIIKKSLGFLFGSTEAHCFTLLNRKGAALTVMNYGAAITSLKIPTATGETVDVVLGFDSIEAYAASYDLPSPPFLGAVVGRFAGRISQGTFSLNGKNITVTKNWKGHQLHGGHEGFSRKFWKVVDITADRNPSITLAYVSPENEEHFPGELAVKVTYTLTELNAVNVAIEATTSEDTIVNLTQHSYFNLNGHTESVENQKLWVNAKNILETTESMIPTGNYIHLNQHAFDFSEAKACPTAIDTTFVLEGQPAAVLYGTSTKLKMTVTTNQPAVHIYVGGNCFETLKGKEQASYHALSGICFETQNFPDAPNHHHFPTALLKKGATYSHETTFLFENY